MLDLWGTGKPYEATMEIRKILVPLSSAVGGGQALATAFVIARAWGSHVVVMHVRPDPRDVAPLAGEGLSGAMIEEMMAATEKETVERTAIARAVFDRMLSDHGVRKDTTASGAGGPSASLVVITGREEELVAQQARLADLTVIAHPEASGDATSADSIHAVLFDSGRPVLLATEQTPASVGERVCLAWNGTAESASAIAAAMPWLKRAKAVRILASEDYQRRGPAAAELAPYLEMHGVSADIARFRPLDGIVGAGLLAAAAEFDADLVAMGAYSHSRLRQLILGGVTRHVLEKAKLPVLMSR